MSTMVDRPTNSWTGAASVSDAAAGATIAAAGSGRACAQSTDVPPAIVRTKIKAARRVTRTPSPVALACFTSPTRFTGATIPTLLTRAEARDNPFSTRFACLFEVMSLLLTDNFACALVAANDLDRGELGGGCRGGRRCWYSRNLADRRRRAQE